MLSEIDHNSILTEIYQGIYSRKNHLSKPVLDYYVSKLDTLAEKQWYLHNNIEKGDLSGDYLDGKLSKDMVQREFHERLIEYFALKKMWIFCHGNFLRLKTGESSTLKDSLIEYLMNFVEIVPYKLAIYMSDFEGGEIVFPAVNFKYKPEAGEMLIIKIDPELDHYTEVVTSGTRYVYFDYLVKHPPYIMP